MRSYNNLFNRRFKLFYLNVLRFANARRFRLRYLWLINAQCFRSDRFFRFKWCNMRSYNNLFNRRFKLFYLNVLRFANARRFRLRYLWLINARRVWRERRFHFRWRNTRIDSYLSNWRFRFFYFKDRQGRTYHASAVTRDVWPNILTLHSIAQFLRD